jgi:hypothetical protein
LWENRFATTGCAKTPSQSANSILEDWVTLIAIQWSIAQVQGSIQPKQAQL